VWVATANGLSAIDGDDPTRVTRIGRSDGLPGRGVLAIAALADGTRRLVAGTSYGAVIITDGRPSRLGPKDVDLGAVWAVAQDRDGLLWLGTTTGLYRGRATDDTWQRFSLATGELADDWVTALATDGDRVVAGTYHGGVTQLTLGATAGDAVTATHLGDGWVNPGGVALDGDRVLASTMDGLAIHDATGAWRMAAGLPGRDTTAVVRAGETLYVATRRGLAELR
jgi:ligand-binding sensor domain-containing protein